MTLFHWVPKMLTGWLDWLERKVRRQPTATVVPLTMHDVAARRRAMFGDTDRTPCDCPVCRRARDNAA